MLAALLVVLVSMPPEAHGEAAAGVAALIAIAVLVQAREIAANRAGWFVVAALVLVMSFEVAVSPAVVGWYWLCYQAKRSIPGLRLETALAWAPLVVAGAVLAGAAIAGAGTWIGARNYRRLLAAR